MKRLFFGFLLLGLILGLLYAFSGRILSAATDKLIRYLQVRGPSLGISVEDVSYGDVRLVGLSIRWADLEFRVEPSEKTKDAIQHVGVHFSTLKMSVPYLLMGGVKLVAENATIVRNPGAMNATVFRAEDFVFSMRASREVTGSLKKQVQEYARELIHFVSDGTTPLILNYQGTSLLELKGEPVSVKVFTRRLAGKTFLEMHPNDLRRIAEVLGEELTEPEIQVYSAYPMRSPKLFYFRNHARQVSKTARMQDSRISRDAYRHLLWSYLLTKEYGPQFAEVVTSAHEEGETDNTEADHIMDYHNNDLGRLYALEGRSEQDLRALVLSDPRVIRSARDAQRLVR